MMNVNELELEYKGARQLALLLHDQLDHERSGPKSGLIMM